MKEPDQMVSEAMHEELNFVVAEAQGLQLAVSADEPFPPNLLARFQGLLVAVLGAAVALGDLLGSLPPG